ncbi:(deoxy)nucleoside triphosphate pyrophosphohydrolase [Candidatus Aquiluna sp. UB-MaderosW2red]|uniref:(deoxy)nucleoside triphosphate pyrophosphohydrolase n=1 Tax=Candidatus Aquiluna sp. UB-MaderosW2red TaxID=1855377 RepID=UPI000875D1F2|nr:(deoxy)nucleoside triphosphate pyrophosphohydrolase [Candidatus Aquiluna sp. UB-MaderosW2red]SCX04021.1 8-oxo-dGTP diphosphatase [Candidatus Aquiluna sp. UB-MaderosW2red]
MPINVVAAIIQDEDGNFFCAKRGSWKYTPDKWEFPGGKAEEGESLELALIREIKEELNVDIKILRLFDSSVTGDIKLICFAAELLGDKPLFSTDHSELAWVSEKELSKLDWAEADLPALRKLLMPFC